MRSIVVDTNACARFFAGDQNVLDAFGGADTVNVSAIVLGELLAGFRGGNRLRENRAVLTSLLERPTVRVLDVGAETAEVFGEVKDALKRAGTPIPINDVWLAAQAIETGSVVVTYDGHFRRVPGLRLWDALA